jgi:Tol biopolymer transport system component
MVRSAWVACAVAISVVTASPAFAADGADSAAPAAVLPVQDAYPHVSREGRVVFQSNRVGGWKLFVARLDGSELRQLTSGPGEDATPIWSPDGRLMVFCSTRGDGENDDIYVIDVDGSNLRRLTDNGLHWDTFPSFSPDGRTILFRRLLRERTSHGTLTNSEIMLMNADGAGVVNLTRHPWFDGWPSWSPDGRRIAFSSNRSDPYQIYVMNADGSGLVRVVDSPYTDNRPQWLPDGKGLIYNREHDARIEMLQVPAP